MKNNFFYKNLEFNAVIFKKSNELFLLARNYEFYSDFLMALKSIPNNPKRRKKYKLLRPTKNLRDNISKSIHDFETVEFIFEEELSEILMIKEDEKKIIFYYNIEFIELMEDTIKTLQWDNPYGEISVEGLLVCPNWWDV
ncbi:MAG TPA: hypothetical protein EYG80_05815 [Flavobacteriaceae bacterium]|nr:hypothetical protein [Flavobacteriaceae bacterium]